MDLAATARSQHGVVTLQQAVAAGMTEDAVHWRVRSGRWRHLAAGLYATTPGDLSWLGRASAALLRAEEGALSLRSAAYVHGFEPKPPAIITLAVPRDRHMRRLPGTRVARRRRLEVVTRRGLAVTTLAQTAIDLADLRGTSWREAVSICAGVVQQTPATTDDLATELRARKRHSHRKILQVGLGIVAVGAESGLEVGFVTEVVRDHGLPMPSLQTPESIRRPGVAVQGLDGGESPSRLRRDAEFVEHGVIAELDGLLGHVGAGMFLDRRRDRKAAAQGKLTVRAGWVDVVGDPCELAADLGAALRSRGWPGRAVPCLRAGCAQRLAASVA